MGILGSILEKILLTGLDHLAAYGPAKVQPYESPGIATYLDRFANTPRSPEWDPEMFSPKRVRNAVVRLAAIHSSHLALHEYGVEEGLVAQTVSIPTLLGLLLAASWRHKLLRRWRRQCIIFLGSPAAGKSTLMLQLAHELARRASQDRNYPIPVYVNLCDFRQPYEYSLRGLEELTRDSIAQGCPRYLKSLEERESSEDLLSNQNVRLLIFFDGVDEMPISNSAAGEYSARIQALALFIERYAQHRFAITCRERDYVTLRDYKHDFQFAIQRVLPWTRVMFERYIAARRYENEAGLAAIQDSLRSRGTDLWGHFAESPLLGALMFGGGRLKPATTIGGAWENFVSAWLRPAFPNDGHFAAVVANLECFAFARTLEPSRPFQLDPETERSAIARGLLIPARPNPEFAIKPLQHYFSARYIWQRAQLGPEMDDLQVWHPKLVVTFQIVCELGQRSPGLYAYPFSNRPELQVAARRSTAVTPLRGNHAGKRPRRRRSVRRGAGRFARTGLALR